jgi:hypothetical protein
MFLIPLILVIFCSDYVINIFWTRHASERFWERALLYGITKTEFEEIIRKQEVRLNQGFDAKYNKQKFQTIGVIAKHFFTIEKAEDKKEIVVITLWESKESEITVWYSKR